MTEEAIVEKLRATLSDAVDSECKVLYVLAECRKLLESYPPDPMPFALKLYCHWALHIDLVNPGTTLPFLTRVDEFAGSVLAGSQDIAKEHQMFQEFVFLDTFKQQFKQLLEAFNLPTDICDDGRWHEFLKHYAGIIEDGSLSCRADDRLKLVTEVVFRKGRPTISDSHIPFVLSWDIVLRDRRTITVDVQSATLPIGQMISHGICIH